MSWQADTVSEIKIVSAIVYSSKIQKGRFYLPMNLSLQQNVQYFEKYLPKRGPAGSDLPNRGPARKRSAIQRAREEAIQAILKAAGRSVSGQILTSWVSGVKL